MLDFDTHCLTIVDIVASIADVEPTRLCQELFDTVMEQTPIEELDTDVPLELISTGHDPFNTEKIDRKSWA